MDVNRRRTILRERPLDVSFVQLVFRLFATRCRLAHKAGREATVRKKRVMRSEGF